MQTESTLVTLSKQVVLDYLLGLTKTQIPLEIGEELFYEISYSNAIEFLRSEFPFYKWSKELVRKNLNRLESYEFIHTLYDKTAQKKLFRLVGGIDGSLQVTTGKPTVNVVPSPVNTSEFNRYIINAGGRARKNILFNNIIKLNENKLLDIINIPASQGDKKQKNVIKYSEEKMGIAEEGMVQQLFRTPSSPPSLDKNSDCVTRFGRGLVFEKGFLSLSSVDEMDEERKNRKLGRPKLETPEALQVLAVYKQVYGNKTVNERTPTLVEGIPRALAKFRNFFGDHSCEMLCLALQHLAQEDWLRKNDPKYFAKSAPKVMFCDTRLENYLLPLADHLSQRKAEGKAILDTNLYNSDGSIKRTTNPNSEGYRQVQADNENKFARALGKSR